jgi:hypothetical protein
MEVFEMGIDQLIPAPRIPRVRAVNRRMVAINEDGVAITFWLVCA